MHALRGVLLALLQAIESDREADAMLSRQLPNGGAGVPGDAVAAPLADGLGIGRVERDAGEPFGDDLFAAELFDDAVMFVHGGVVFGRIFPIVKMENVAQDSGAPCGQEFRMSSKTSDPYAIECGQRLERLRVALGHGSRASLARYMFDPENEEELRREADNIRKYESGVMPPPRFLRRLEELTQEPGIIEYIYKDASGRLSEDVRNKVRHAEQDGAKNQSVGRNIPFRKVRLRP